MQFWMLFARKKSFQIRKTKRNFQNTIAENMCDGSRKENMKKHYTVNGLGFAF